MKYTTRLVEPVAGGQVGATATEVNGWVVGVGNVLVVVVLGCGRVVVVVGAAVFVAPVDKKDNADDHGRHNH